MGRKAARDSSESESESDRRAKDKKRGKDDRKDKRDRRSRSRGRSKERRKERSPEKKPAPKRGRSESEGSDSDKSSDDEEEMKEFLLSTDMPEDQMLSKMMGFSAFDSSKGKDHGSSDLSDVKRATKRQYRQYMNRRGGFNRPLDAAF
eukprot:gb/GFBE01041554.1/.p1 GENE.gb/GFBE01041554.1/~~gb/GFBE01041554.1/.p1  ORF type:complete len:148 (+),score=37.96 gb/GFBE01041554.1/:1-444(+)